MPFVSLGSIRLHYLEEGAGPPLLWLPGGNDSAALMLHAHRPLAGRVRLIALDPRGQGESDAPTTAEAYSPEAQVADVLGMLNALELERAVVGGHSRGGRTSVEFALTHPERVAGVIAAASPLLGATPERTAWFRRYQRTLREKGVEAFLAMLRSGPRHPERRAGWRAAAHHAGADALIAQYEVLCGLPSLTPALGGLSVPALFLSGDRDFLLEHAREAAAAAPGARLVVISGAGHALFSDNADQYFAALTAFLDDVAPECSWSER